MTRKLYGPGSRLNRLAHIAGLAAGVLAAIAVGTAAHADERSIAATVIKLRNAPCSDIRGTAPYALQPKERGTKATLVDCSNGARYVVLDFTALGAGYALARVNSLTGAIEPYLP
jgi:hypothetical protein